MRKRGLIVAALMLLGLVATPRTASADGFFTPFMGVTFGGDASTRRPTYGFGFTFMGGGVIGVDADFGITPDFFGKSANPVLGGGNSVTSVMGSIVLAIPLGGQHGAGLRPYVLAGGGLLRQHVAATGVFSAVSTNDFGIDLGAGLIGFFSDHLGIRGEARYFRSLNNQVTFNGVQIVLGKFDFWRGTGGLVIRF